MPLLRRGVRRMYEIHMEKCYPGHVRPESEVQIFRAQDERSAHEIAKRLERTGTWLLLKMKKVEPTPPNLWKRRYRIRWRDDAIGYVEV